MKKQVLGLGLLLIGQVTFANTFVDMKTNMGNIEIELFDQQAPVTTQNFKNYVKSNFYSGTVFHRVIPGFMIQGGGMTTRMVEKSGNAPIKNESYNGLHNVRGTLAMARTNDPNSATSQFFINTVDNKSLDRGTFDIGYAVFAKVVKGMDVVDRISKVATTNYGVHQNVPVKPIIIQSVQIVSKSAKK